MPRQVFFPTPRKTRGYSPVTKAGNMVFVSGQTAYDADRNLVGPGDCRAQSEQAYRNLEAALRTAGATLDDITKLTVFLVNADDFPDYESVCMERFPENGPASSTVIVTALVRPEILVEVEAIAVVD